MDYETIDWELEAKRVMAAFNIAECCEFVDRYTVGKVLVGSNEFDPLSDAPSNRDGLTIRSQMNEHHRYFAVQDDNGVITSVSLQHDGGINAGPLWFDYVPVLYKGLFLLGLLNDEIEHELKYSPSHHERLEWALEYEARLEAL
jgi:hypothetical protein